MIDFNLSRPNGTGEREGWLGPAHLLPPSARRRPARLPAHALPPPTDLHPPAHAPAPTADLSRFKSALLTAKAKGAITPLQAAA